MVEKPVPFSFHSYVTPIFCTSATSLGAAPKQVSEMENVASGTLATVTIFLKVSLLQPSWAVMASRTGYRPGRGKTCGGGFTAVLDVPSPKSQWVAAIFVKEIEVFVNPRLLPM